LGALVDRLREYVNRNYSYLVEEVRKLGPLGGRRA